MLYFDSKIIYLNQRSLYGFDRNNLDQFLLERLIFLQLCLRDDLIQSVFDQTEYFYIKNGSIGEVISQINSKLNSPKLSPGILENISRSVQL